MKYWDIVDVKICLMNNKMNIIKKIYVLYQKRKIDKFFKEFERHGMKIGYKIEPCGKTQTFM